MPHWRQECADSVFSRERSTTFLQLKKTAQGGGLKLLSRVVTEWSTSENRATDLSDSI
jgi:hypothetical protein